MCVIDTSATICEVGGGDIDIDFQLRNEFGGTYSAEGCKAQFVIADWLYRSPILFSCDGILKTDKNGAFSIISVHIPGAITADMCGAYVYQIGIRDDVGNLEPPIQGKMIISMSADADFAKGG